AAVMAFLARTTGFERVDGSEVIEVRAAGMSKSLTVPWLRERAGADARIIAIGDDVTDEHMFAALGPRDEPVLVHDRPPKRRTAARWRLRDTQQVREFLRWLVSSREGEAHGEPVIPVEIEPRSPARAATNAVAQGLLVVSNRLPDLRVPELPAESGIYDGRKRNVGGLVSALQPALEQRGGLWLGWSGRAVPENEEPSTGMEESTVPPMAWLDFTERWVRDHYGGFCNRTLWPLFHSFPERTQFSEAQWRAYVEVNAAFADACDSLGRHEAIWAHDYHLLLLARELRRRGHTVPIGMFLHIPFPPLDLLSMLPWADEVLDAMCDFDLVAFHTPDFAANFIRCVTALLGATAGDDAVMHRGRKVAVRSIPIGILAEGWEEANDAESSEELAALQNALAGRKLVLGVDRLDYTKGIPERLLAFGRLLEQFPEWRDQVSLVQVSVPSRADVPDYVEQRARIESIVGRINGEFGEAHWVPIRYLYRSYGPRQLAQLYRLAHVGYVTPLRDGMNLVAKEYVAAQDAADPGALLLSRFAGAAHEMRDAVLTNPWFVDGMAKDLDRCLRMPLDERRDRHQKLRAVVERTSATSWAETFLTELMRTR
ncbi:MAG TPA: trehalose-6-phosphate synthase, partial [Nannocystaceae bacterium]|nr:trehalose-6-phosphate synthase [Nannocystaceae bacterium]